MIHGYSRRIFLMIMIIVGLLSTLLVLVSCESESLPFCPIYKVGAVEGSIMFSGEGVSTKVWARAQEGPRSGQLINQTVSDSTGMYRIELPLGLYRIQVRPSSGNSISPAPYDTIRIIPAIKRLDFQFGQAEINVAMPPELNGKSITLSVTDSSDRDYSSWARVRNGLWQNTISFLPLGTYSMSMSLPGNSDDIYLPGTFDSQAADSLVVTAESTALYEADFSNQYASISGHVTGSWQEADDGWARIKAYTDGYSNLSSITCSNDGSFQYDYMFPQAVRLMVDIGGVTQWIGGDSFFSATRFDLQPGDRITDISVIESGIQIQLNGPGYFNNHDAALLLVDEYGNTVYWGTTYDGSFSVCNLQPGQYYLQVDGFCYNEIWQPQWYDGSETLEDATPFILGEGELQTGEINLVEGGGIQGEVVTFNGQSIPYMTILIVDAHGDPLCLENSGYFRRWDGGSIDFKGLADGDYYLAVHQSSGPWWYPGKWTFEAATPIKIADHSTVDIGNWALPDYSKEAK